MKTKELIRRLNEADPSGEIECCVGNADIYYVSKEPAYWDGCLQVLKRDPKKEGKQYSIIGAEIHSEGEKICLNTMNFSDVLLNHPDAPIEIKSTTDWVIEDYTKLIGSLRKETKEIIGRVRGKKK